MPPKTTARRVLHAGLALVAALTVAACGSTTTTTVHSDPPAQRQNAHAEQEQQHRQAEAQHREAIALARTQRAEAAAQRQEREAQEPLERWRALQHDLISALLIQGGAETYERISGEAEAKGRAYAASEIKTMVESLSTTRRELALIARHSPQACASAIENVLALLKQRQSIVEQTRVNSMGSEYGWANTAHELEPLELPEGHLGDGLEACDPSGTGEIEEESN